jgi:hypothetical protein
MKAGGEFVRENLNVAAQYADWVTGGEVATVKAIPPGYAPSCVKASGSWWSIAIRLGWHTPARLSVRI